jgi:hypothetical protein
LSRLRLRAQLDRALQSGVVWQDFAVQEDLFTATIDRFTDNVLRSTVGVHFSGINENQSQI